MPQRGNRFYTIDAGEDFYRNQNAIDNGSSEDLDNVKVSVPENPFRGNKGTNSHVLSKKTSHIGVDKKSQSLSRTRGKDKHYRPDTRKKASITPHSNLGAAANRYQPNNAHMKIHDENDEDVLIGDNDINTKRA